MKLEGRLREHDLKWGVYEDIDVYAILAREWSGEVGGGRPDGSVTAYARG
jgi:hypothetical protein